MAYRAVLSGEGRGGLRRYRSPSRKLLRHQHKGRTVSHTRRQRASDRQGWVDSLVGPDGETACTAWRRLFPRGGGIQQMAALALLDGTRYDRRRFPSWFPSCQRLPRGCQPWSATTTTSAPTGALLSSGSTRTRATSCSATRPCWSTLRRHGGGRFRHRPMRDKHLRAVLAPTHHPTHQKRRRANLLMRLKKPPLAAARGADDTAFR